LINNGFLNTNSAITGGTDRNSEKGRSRMEASCGGKRVRGQRKMSQVLGEFGLLDFTVLRSVFAWHAFLNLVTLFFFKLFFNFFFSGRGKTADTESVETGSRL
jgi:hypothetical protein